jgi:transcriptional/translational regulatory protein YebC/TACO1
MFDHVGMVTYPATAASEDAMMEAAIEAGAEDCRLENDEHVVISGKSNLNEVREALEKKFGAPTTARFAWVPKSTTSVTAEEAAQSLYKLTEMLDDNDDVQHVVTNADVAAHLLEKLAS